jgi:hypothetical protein
MGAAANRTWSLVLSLLLAIFGIVLWLEGGSHPRTWGAWLLLVAILVAATGVVRTGRARGPW